MRPSVRGGPRAHHRPEEGKVRRRLVLAGGDDGHGRGHGEQAQHERARRKRGLDLERRLRPGVLVVLQRGGTGLGLG